MITNKIRKTILLLITISIFAGLTLSSASGVTDGTNVSPIRVSRPSGPMMQILHNGFLGMIRNMESANFTPDNVYYGTYDNVGSYTYSIVRNNERNFSVNLSSFQRILNSTISRLQEDPNAVPSDLAYLESLYAEIEEHNQINLYHKVDSNLNVTSSQDRKEVTILYDGDKSVIEALDAIKENRTITSQPFTGDEIFTNVFMSLVTDEITGTYEEWNQWTYEDGSNASQLREFVVGTTNNKLLMRELNFLYRFRDLNIMRTMTGPNHIFNDIPRSIERGRFSVSQLKINTLNLKKTGQNLIINEFDYIYLEHHLLGNLIYNDTNSNGFMDIGVETETIGIHDIAYPSIGDEALYRFDMENIQTRSYQKPETNGDLLEFGATFTNVEGYLNPLEKNEDSSLFDVSTESLHTIDEVSTLFHFVVNNTDGSVSLKFDYVLGNWDNANELEGLSFNQLMATTAIDSSMTHRIQWRHENGTEMNNEEKNSSRMHRFRLGVVDDQFGEVSLDEIPYLWDDTEEVYAVGQLIPLNLIEITYGRISSEGDMIRSLTRNIQSETYLYSVSYPKWEGKSIIHDPSFSVMGGQAAEASNTDNTSGVIPGFEFISAIFTLPILYTISVYYKKRKN
ncbi:MAG: Heimdall-CTERM domain-containing surface protein [Candidatus Hodarchaeales archaeon]